MNNENTKKYFSSQKHDYCVEIENFDIDKVSFYVSNNFTYHKVYTYYLYDDNKIRELQLKTHFHHISANAHANEPIININIKDAMYLSTLMNMINIKFTEYCSSEKNVEKFKDLKINVHEFIKTVSNKKFFRIKIDENTKLINYNLSKKYGLVENIPNVTIESLKKIIPCKDYTNFRKHVPKKEGSFVLRPYFGCVKKNDVKTVDCFGMLVAHTAEIKYMDATIRSTVDYKTCEPRKIQKHGHITLTV